MDMVNMKNIRMKNVTSKPPIGLQMPWPYYSKILLCVQHNMSSSSVRVVVVRYNLSSSPVCVFVVRYNLSSSAVCVVVANLQKLPSTTA